MKIKAILIWLCVILPFGVFSQEKALFISGEVSVGNDSSYSNVTLYVKGNIIVDGSDGVLTQNGLTTVTGDFINNVVNGNVFEKESYGTVLFQGSDIQHIRGSADKSLNYINFPDVKVSNANSVAVTPNMGMEVRDLELEKGRLVLQSEIIDAESRNVEIAHLLVKQGGNVIYNRDDSKNIEENGVIEVELALGDNFQNKRLVGFSSPFKRIYSDYFTFNYLSKPSPVGLFGDSNTLITDLRFPLDAGMGYIVGQGIIDDEDYINNHLDPQWSEADYNDRYTTKFSFDRDFMPHSFGQYNMEADRFAGEEINISDVTVTLTKRGFNYVGNPFTTPIDLSSFVEETNSVDEWGVTRGVGGVGELRNSFYVISGGSGSYNNATQKFTFTVSYLLGQAVGGTLSTEEYPSYQIAPMQMFIVGKNADGESDFKIPASVRSHGPAPFLRSTPHYIDEIMIESVDEGTLGYDRLCIVFRNDASLSSRDPYDAVKLFNYSGGVSQIYTVSSDNKNMTTNVISPSTKSVDIYFRPSNEVKKVHFNTYRLSSLESISELWLEDRYTNSLVNLFESPGYEFTSNPQDDPQRFILHFEKPAVVNIENPIVEMNIRAFSEENRIYLQGLTEEDINSKILLSDIQGRTLYQGQIGEIPTMEIDSYLIKGIYIVNIVGQRNSIIKVIVN